MGDCLTIITAGHGLCFSWIYGVLFPHFTCFQKSSSSRIWGDSVQCYLNDQGFSLDPSSFDLRLVKCLDKAGNRDNTGR